MDKKIVVAANMKKYRELRGFSQSALSDNIKIKGGKVEVETIKKVEQGKANPTFDTLAWIAGGLEIDFEELFVEDSRSLYLRIMLSDQNMKTLENIKDFIDKALEAKKKQAG